MAVEVDHDGHVDLERWAAAVHAPGTAAACIQVANHEVGTMQPYADTAQICQRADVPLMLDATSALGRIELAEASGWSVLTGWAGAFGGPTSVGILVIKKNVRWRAPYPTDDYQDGRWPGVPDVPAIYSAAVALDCWVRSGRAVGDRQHGLIDRLRTEIAQRVPDVDVAGDPVHRVPHLLTFSVLYVDGETLTLELDKAGFAVASGSACSASSEHPSHVLAAMGALTHGNIRVGLTWTTSAEEIDRFLSVLPPIVAQIRSTVGAP
jgi:cysteine desulfurase